MEASISNSSVESSASQTTQGKARKGGGAAAEGGLAFLSIFASASNPARNSALGGAPLMEADIALSKGNSKPGEQDFGLLSTDEAILFDADALDPPLTAADTGLSHGGAADALTQGDNDPHALLMQSRALSAASHGEGAITASAAHVQQPMQNDGSQGLARSGAQPASTSEPALPMGARATAARHAGAQGSAWGTISAMGLQNSALTSTVSDLPLRFQPAAGAISASAALALQAAQQTAMLNTAAVADIRTMVRQDDGSHLWNEAAMAPGEGSLEVRSWSTAASPVATFTPTVGLAGALGGELTSGFAASTGGSDGGMGHSASDQNGAPGQPETDNAQAQEDALQEQLQEWSKEALDVAEATLRQGGQTVQVQVALAGKDAQVQLRSDESQLRDLMEQEQEQLRQNLQEQGLSLSQLSVGDSDAGDSADTQRQLSEGKRAESALADEPSPNGAASPSQRSVRDGGVDTFA